MRITKELVILENDEIILSKEEAIKILTDKLIKTGYINNYEDYLESVYKREEIAPTTVGYEIGLPHGKGKSVKESVVAFMRVKNPILWNIQDNEKVKMIFMLAISEEDGKSIHNDILVDLSKKILDHKFRERMEKSKNVEEIVELINK